MAVTKGYEIGNITALKALVVTDFVSGYSRLVSKPNTDFPEPNWYTYDSAATDAADDYEIVQPNAGSGRWFRSGSVTRLTKFVAKTAGFTAADADHDTFIVLTPTANVTITLNDSPSFNIAFTVFLNAAFTVTYTAGGTATIKSASTSQTTLNKAVSVTYDASNAVWYLLGDV